MEWHPTKPSILAVGSKGGDIILWDTDSVNKDKFVQGVSLDLFYFDHATKSYNLEHIIAQLKAMGRLWDTLDLDRIRTQDLQKLSPVLCPWIVALFSHGVRYDRIGNLSYKEVICLVRLSLLRQKELTTVS